MAQPVQLPTSQPPLPTGARATGSASEFTAPPSAVHRPSLLRSLTLPRDLPKRLSTELHLAKSLLQERLRTKEYARPISPGASTASQTTTRNSSHLPRPRRYPLSPPPSQRLSASLFLASPLASLPLSSSPPLRVRPSQACSGEWISASSSQRLSFFRHIAVIAALALLSFSSAARADAIWTANGTTPELGNSLNWLGGTLPNPGDILDFSGAPPTNISNTLPITFVAGGMVFDTSASFTFFNNKMILNGSLIDNSRNHTQSLTFGLTLNSTQTFDVEYGGIVTTSQIIDGTGTGTVGLTKTGGGILNLNAGYGLHGPLTIQGGVVSATNDGSLGPSGSTIILDGGALRLTANTTISNTRSILLGEAGGGSGTLDLASATYAGVIADNGGPGSLIKTGGDSSGTSLTLTGSNTYSGDTSINQGAIKLDFSAATAPSSNILYHGVPTAGTLYLGGLPTKLGNTSVGGGILIVQPKASTNNSQTFNGLVLNQGNNQIKALTASGAGILLNLGSITRTEGGVINFALPGAAAPSATNAIRTTTGNDHGILGAWATVSVGTTYNWAANDGAGNIIAYSGYTVLASPTISSNTASNIQITSGTSGNVTMAAGGVTDVNTIQVTDLNPRTIDIGSGNTLRLGDSGGIWRSVPSTSTSAITIGVAGSAGVLTAGGANNTAGVIVLRGRIAESGGASNSFVINSTIADNGTGPVQLVIASTQPDDGTNDTGATVLNAANSYTGGTYVNSGTLITNNAGSLGTGAVVVMPGAQVILNASGVTNDFFIAGNTITAAWTGTTHAALRITGTLGAADLSSTLGLTGDAMVGVTGASATINSTITGSANITFEGNGTASPGTITLANPNNNYSGNTNIGKVTLRVGAASSGGLGVIPYGSGNGDVIFTGNFGTLDLNGFTTSINGLATSVTTPQASAIVTNGAASGVATLSLGNGNVSANFSGTIQDGASAVVILQKVGTGVQVLSGTNTYSGNTMIENGVLQSGATNSFSPNSIVQLDSSTAILRLSGHDNTIAGLNGSGIVENFSYNSGINILTTSTGTFSGTLRDGPGVGPLGITKNGPSNLLLSGNNSYTGPTTINGGNIQAGSTTALGVNSAVTVGASGQLQTEGYSLTLGALNGSGSVQNGSNSTAATVTAGTLNQDNSFSGSLSDGGSAPLAYTKAGTGTQTFSGNNTYSGPTTVNAGTLNVSGTINSDVTVNPGARFAYNNTTTAYTKSITLNGSGTGVGQRAVLGGSGFFNVNLSLTSKNNVLSPGNSPGVMTFMTGQLWNSFTFDWETNSFHTQVAGTNFDQIQIQGGLNLTGGNGAYQLNLITLASDNFAGSLTDFNEQNQTWTILTTTSGISGFNASNWTIDSSQFTATPTAPTGTYTVQKSADGKSLQVTYTTPVPEPGSALLVIVVGLIGILKKRR